MSTYRVLLITSLTSVLGSPAPARTEPPSAKTEWNFDQDEVGKPPPGWRAAQTEATGKPAKWAIERDEAAPSKPNVLKSVADAEEATFNLFVAESTSLQDVEVSVRVRPDTGKVDQGGGLVWRCQDENNYYICRINPLETNFRVYKVVGGKRQQLQGVELKTETGKWYEVRAKMVGDHITCSVDGKVLLDVTDGTITAAGKVGLWTKADACSSFDALKADAPNREKGIKP